MSYMKNKKIKKRIFIVGIARSGTTLLQSMLGSHPDVFTLPETHFWDRSMAKQKTLRLLQIINKKDINFVKKYFSKIDFNKNNKWPSLIYSKKRWTKFLITQIDKLSLAHSKNIWVEKTPLNLYYIDLITSVYPETYFIHTIRRGIDNIASLYEASKENPEYFAQSTIDKCINRYDKEINISRKYLKNTNHYFVLYDKLVENPEEVLKRVCGFLNIDYKKEMLEYSKTARKIITPEESWKSKNISEINKSEKKNKVLTKEQISYINSRLKKINLADFEQ